MSVGEQQAVKPSILPLRVFVPKETDRSNVFEAADGETDARQSASGLDAEVESFWAGRNPATRLSARIAA